MPHKKVVFISCCARKLKHEAPAKELYVSPLFKGYLAYGKAQNPDEIWILSAKYGLISLDKRINPYNFTLRNQSKAKIKEWSDLVLRQIKSRFD